MKISYVQNCNSDNEIFESGILCTVRLKSQLLLGIIKQIR